MTHIINTNVFISYVTHWENTCFALTAAVQECLVVRLNIVILYIISFQQWSLWCMENTVSY